jgi:catecholate siderophore receptor
MTIQSRKHPAGRYLAALALAASPALAHAGATTGDLAETTQVVVRANATGYKANTDSSPKHTEALLDTPQTLTVIKAELLGEQNATSLTDALRNTPGITLQLGENGSTAAGDTFQLRGFSAQSSIFVDGIRDLGAVTRDVFNIDQIEVAKGPAGSDIGRGAAAGSINQVSRLPTLSGGSSATASVYSQGGARASVDVDDRVGQTQALRLNLMDQSIDVAGRDFVRNRGYGIAPAYAAGLGTDTRFYLFGQVVHQDNRPDGGIPVIGYAGFYNADARIAAGTKVDPKNYYGARSDYENVDAALLTSKIEHDFAGGFHLTNTARYGQTRMDRVITGIGNNAGGYTESSADPSTWTIIRNRQRVDQTNRILADTTNISGTIDTGSWTQDVSLGTEFDYEQQKAPAFAVPAGAVVTPANVYHPNPDDVLAVPQRTGAFANGEVTTVSAYAFDTLKHGPWLINGGVRIDSYTAETVGALLSTTATYPKLPAGTLVPYDLKKSGTVTSWNAGLVYKPAENGSLYIAYADAFTPPGSSNLTFSATAGNIAGAAFKPTQTDSLEIGTKWDLIRKKLSVTAAWYDTVARNELTLQDPVTLNYIQLGKRDINGFEFSAIGQITPQWSVSAGIETLHTQIKEGTTSTNATGAATRWSPDLTGTIWTTYKLTPRLTLATGASYVSDQKLLVTPGAVQTTGLAKIPAYWIADAMTSYALTPKATLQLNIYNLSGAKYIQSLNNGGARIFPGQPQSASLTLNVKL